MEKLHLLFNPEMLHDTPVLLAARWPELVTRSNLTARETGKCSLAMPRGRKMTWQLSATHCVCIVWSDVVQMRMEILREGVFEWGLMVRSLGNIFVS